MEEFKFYEKKKKLLKNKSKLYYADDGVDEVNYDNL